MAEQKLGDVYIFYDKGDLKKGDTLVISVDTSSSARKIRVRKNGVERFSGTSLTAEKPAFFSRSTTGYKRIEKGFRYTYPTKSSFPYHSEKKERISADDPDDGGSAVVDDVQISAYFISQATGRTAYDGVVRVSAKGTNSPFLFSQFNPEDQPDEALQKSGTFSLLPAGDYTFYVRDSLGYIDSVDVTVGIFPNADYGTRWRFEFVNGLGVTKRVDIEERGYSGSITDIQGGTDAYSLSSRADGQDLPNIGAIATQLSIDLHTNTRDKFRALSLGDEKKYRVKQYVNSTTLEFVGYIRPSSYSDVLGQPPYNTRVVAYDGIGDLKLMDFLYGVASETGINPRQLVKGNISHLFALKICLDKLKINNGYRIACNIFSTGQDSSSGNTPLEQTYFDPVIYTSDDGTSVSNCGDVVKDILRVYNAFMVSWDGYWWIVRQEEMLQSTVNYVEFNRELEYVTTGSWNPQIEFNRPEDSGGFRWSGAQARTFTKVYKKIVLSPKVESEKNLLTNEFTGANLTFRDGQAVSFKGFELGAYNEGSRSSIYLKNSQYVWDLSLPIAKGDNRNSSTYIMTRGRVDFEDSDFVKINAKFNIIQRWLADGTDTPPYFTFKWSLRMHDRWLRRDGYWSSSAILNEEYVSGSTSSYTFDREFRMFTSTGRSSKTYTLKIYGISLTESTAKVPYQPSIANVVARVRQFKYAQNIPGTRKIVAREGATETFLYFYQMENSGAADDGLVVIRPSDHNSGNGAVWRMIGTIRLRLNLEGSSAGRYIGTVFEDVSLEFLQDGNSDSFKAIASAVSNNSNEDILSVEMNQFDLDFAEVRNPESIIKDYLKLSDGSPTSNWRKSSGGKSKSIQGHQLDWLSNIAKRARAIINGSIHAKEEVTPLNVLKDAGDNNRVYLLNGSTITNKNEISGQFLEISSDDQAGASFSAYSTGFKQNSFT